MLADGSDPASTRARDLAGRRRRADRRPPRRGEGASAARGCPGEGVLDGRAVEPLGARLRGSSTSACYALERKEFVRREHRSAVAGSRQYAFVHALVRDGVYGQMSRAARADVHRRVADWIETLPSDRADDRAEILAHHLLAAIEYSRAASVDDVGARAARSAGAHGSPATERWQIGAACRAALDFYGRLRELDPVRRGRPVLPALASAWRSPSCTGTWRKEQTSWSAPPRRSRARIPPPPPRPPMTRGEFVWQRGDQDGAFAYFDRARQLADGAPLSPEKQNVVAQVARFLSLGGTLRTRRWSSSSRRSRWPKSSTTTSCSAMRSIPAGSSRSSPRSTPDGRRTARAASSSLSAATRVSRWPRLHQPGVAARRRRRATSPARRRSRARGSPSASGWGSRGRRCVGSEGNLAEMTYLSGAWDEALALAESVIVGETHYVQQLWDSAFEPRFAWRAATIAEPPRTWTSRCSKRGRSATRRLSTQRSSWPLESHIELETRRVRTRSSTSSRARNVRRGRSSSGRLSSATTSVESRFFRLGRTWDSGTPWADVSTAIAARRARTSRRDPRAYRRAHARGRRVAASCPALPRQTGASARPRRSWRRLSRSTERSVRRARPRGRGAARRGS